MEEIDHARLSYSFRQICVQTERLVNRALDQEEVTVGQAHVLRFIRDRSQRGTSLTEIHKAFGCSMATLSSLVKRLREKGYVRTEPCQADDRCKLLFSTRKSLEMQEFLQACAGRSEDVLYRDFSPEERASLDRLQQKMLCNLSAFSSHTPMEG